MLLVLSCPSHARNTPAPHAHDQIAEAYEHLKDAPSRRAYAAGGGRKGEFSSRGRGFHFRDAEELFAGEFGESLWRDWEPGMHVEGELVRGDRTQKITIFPDGTVSRHNLSHTFAAHMQIYTNTDTDKDADAGTDTDTHAHTHTEREGGREKKIYIYIYMYIYMYIYTCISTNRQANIYIYTHTHTHTQTARSQTNR